MRNAHTIKILLIALAFAVPLFWNYYQVSQYDLSKAMVVYVIAGLILALCAWRRFKGFRWYTGKLLPLSILLFVFVSGLATIFSFDPQTSFFGCFTRYDGFLITVAFAFIFFVVINVIEHRDIDKLFDVVILAACMASAYGIAQYYGWDLYYPSHNAFGEGGRTYSTFGHPAFFSAFLIMVVPLVLARYFSHGSHLWLVPLAVIVVALYQTQTRAAFVGLVVSLAFFFTFTRHCFSCINKTRYVLALVVVAGITIFYNVGITNAPTITSRLIGDIEVDPDTGSLGVRGNTQHRLFYYGMAWAIIKDKPFLGVGQDTLNQVFLKYVARDYLEMDTELETVSRLSVIDHGVTRYISTQSRVHNSLLDMAVSRGLIGLASYLFLIYAYIRMVWRRCGEGNVVVVALVSGCIAYFVQNQFSMDHISFLYLFWILVGMSFVACGKET